MNTISERIKKHFDGDVHILLIVILLSIVGVIIQFSAKGRLTMGGPFVPLQHLVKSLVILVGGFYAMGVFSRKDYLKSTKYVDLALYGSWFLIGLAYLYGKEAGGASRWLQLGPLSFMPSDMAKLCLTISLSKMFAARQADPEAYDPAVLFVICFKLGVTCFLIFLSNFSTSVIVFVTSIVLMIFGRVPYKAIAIVLGIFISTGIGLIVGGVGQRAETIKHRIEVYVKRMFGHPSKEEIELDDQGTNYQLKQSLYAIATGGLQPKGPGNSQFRFHLSQAESDFVYAIIVEEWGIVAGFLLPVMFMWLFWRGALAISYSSKPLGGLMSAGLTFSIVSQAFLNMFVAVGAIPVTGQPIPLVSAGGTSLIFTMISIGYILSVTRDKAKTQLARA
ncbi:FtsW/RodA/SpoVE family cell cycle protein [Aquirufa sp. TARAVU-A1A]